MGETSDFDVREYLRILFHYWWVFVLFPTAFGGIAYGAASSMTPMYESATRILVQQSSGGTALNLSDVNLNIALVRTYTELVDSRAVRALAEPSLDPAALSGLKVSAEVVPGTQILRIVSEHRDPQIAAHTANAFAVAFIDFIQQQQFEALSRLQAAAAIQGAVGVDFNLLAAQLQATTALSIVDQALPPGAPASPQVRRITALSIFFGILLAIPSAFVMNRVRDRLETLDTVENRFGLVPLGALSPWARPNRGNGRATSLEVASEDPSATDEQFRNLRASLQFRIGPSGAKAIAVTSAGEAEGKSSVCSNLAAVLAFDGMTVVLVDADMRRPSVHTILGLPNTKGLSNYLALETTSLDEIIVPTHIPGLLAITSGPKPPNPAELLNSPAFGKLVDELRSKVDMALIDTPPVNAVADASLISSRVDGTILVADARKTKIPDFRSLVKRLQLADANVLGVVINKARGAHDRASYYYGNARQKRSFKSVLRFPWG